MLGGDTNSNNGYFDDVANVNFSLNLCDETDKGHIIFLQFSFSIFMTILWFSCYLYGHSYLIVTLI